MTLERTRAVNSWGGAYSRVAYSVERTSIANNLDMQERQTESPNRQLSALNNGRRAMTERSVPQILPLRARRTSAAGDLYRRNRHGWADTAGGSPAWLLTAQAIPQTSSWPYHESHETIRGRNCGRLGSGRL